MFMNNREDLFLFVEDEQATDGQLRPSTLLGWVMDSEGSIFPVTPSSGVVKTGWAVYDLQLEVSVGHTTARSKIDPKAIADWVAQNISTDDIGERLH